MWTDPIVDEVRASRRAIAAEAGNEIHEMFRRARMREALLADRSRPPVAEPTAADPSTGKRQETGKPAV